jgi:hypothetical protein
MPAYTQHHPKHHDVDAALTICPSCLRLPMQIREVLPRWDLARVDFVYECPMCCIEIRETVAKH